MIVDPRFAGRLRELRESRSLSYRGLARLAYCSHTAVWELEAGHKRPSPELAASIDDALAAGGELSRLVTEHGSTLDPYEADRLVAVTANPRRLDGAAVDALTAVLAHQRRLEDVIGSAPLVAPVLAQLAVIDALVAEVPDRHRVKLVDTAAQWAQFAGWLNANTGRHSTRTPLVPARDGMGRRGRHANMVAAALSMCGHLAWTHGQISQMIGLSQAAAWQPAGPDIRALAVQQEARGLALAGEADACDRRFADAEALLHEAADHSGCRPPWIYFYDPNYLALQRGLAYHYLGRHGLAVDLLTRALNSLPADLRRSDWIGWYVCQLAATYADAGALDSAVDTLTEARQIAANTRATRLTAAVEKLARQLNA